MVLGVTRHHTRIKPPDARSPAVYFTLSFLLIASSIILSLTAPQQQPSTTKVMSSNANDAPPAPPYTPTPDPVLNNKLYVLELNVIRGQQNMRNHYLKRICQLDPSRPGYHSVVQIILFLLCYKMTQLQQLYDHTVQTYYEEAGLPFFGA